MGFLTWVGKCQKKFLQIFEKEINIFEVEKRAGKVHITLAENFTGIEKEELNAFREILVNFPCQVINESFWC